MHVLVAYNHYRHRVHGEEVVVDTTDRLLSEQGIRVSRCSRSSEEILGRPWRQISAGFASLYNPASKRAFARQLAGDRPDVIHVHNLYPLISPSILLAAAEAQVPVVMTVHHYGLSCPAMTHYRDGGICTSCLGGHEIRCLQFNCRGSRLESGLYAVRTGIARRLRLYLDGVSVFIALSEFAKGQLVDAGFPQDRIVVRPNMIRITHDQPNATRGNYVAYVGRITPEKGPDLLCEAARMNGLQVRIAGDASAWPELVDRYRDCAEFVGILHGDKLTRFYREARFVVVPSRWWEVCPLVVLEAMNHSCPVVAARTGGLSEMVLDDVTGLLFERGNTMHLASQMRRLGNDRTLGERLAAAACQRLTERYCESRYLTDLLAIYTRASASVGASSPRP